MGGGISTLECQLRVQELKHEKIKSGAWSQAEHEALLAAIAKHGKTWWKVRDEDALLSVQKGQTLAYAMRLLCYETPAAQACS